MPVQPDPTHPKFLEGDDVLVPPKGQDDVHGHLGGDAVPEETEPEGLARNTDEGDDDVEGHLETR